MEKTSHSTIKEIRHSYQKSLDTIDIDILLAYATGQSRESLLAHPNATLTHTEYTKVIGYMERRINHEPIAYILGKKEFYGLDFIVNQHTLIPRPETELLIDETLKILSSQCKEKNNSKYKTAQESTSTNINSDTIIVDVGTGSGNIIITLAKLLRKKNIRTQLFALDISPDAIKVAKKNAKQHNISENIHFIQSNLLDVFLNFKKLNIESKNISDSLETFLTLETSKPTNDIFILANLPYLSKDIYQSAAPDVKDYEPNTALVSDEDGLAHYHRLLKQVKILLKRKAFLLTTFTLIFEISPEQKSLIEGLIKAIFPDAHSAFIQDYSQRIRFVKIIL